MDQLASNSQLRLLSAGIEGVCHYHPANFIYLLRILFVLKQSHCVAPAILELNISARLALFYFFMWLCVRVSVEARGGY